MGAYKHLNNCVVNLAQAKELSLRRQGLSLKRKVFVQRDWKQRVLRVLAQASPSRSSERPSLRRALKIKGGELL